ncbi:hypothetical protein BT69DRAFT_566371 [Atractiella rhizophila]|nr:hypothetical protein BT69DRAFT_566371 [Atractiella rhizophila]
MDTAPSDFSTTLPSKNRREGDELERQSLRARVSPSSPPPPTPVGLSRCLLSRTHPPRDPTQFVIRPCAAYARPPAPTAARHYVTTAVHLPRLRTIGGGDGT